MAVKVIELKGNKAYKTWMETNGENIEIIDVQATNQKWNIWTGALGSAMMGEKNYTITYKEK